MRLLNHDGCGGRRYFGCDGEVRLSCADGAARKTTVMRNVRGKRSTTSEERVAHSRRMPRLWEKRERTPQGAVADDRYTSFFHIGNLLRICLYDNNIIKQRVPTYVLCNKLKIIYKYIIEHRYNCRYKYPTWLHYDLVWMFSFDTIVSTLV